MKKKKTEPLMGTPLNLLKELEKIKFTLSNFSEQQVNFLGEDAKNRLKAIKEGGGIEKIGCPDGIIRTIDECDNPMALLMWEVYRDGEREH